MDRRWSRVGVLAACLGLLAGCGNFDSSFDSLVDEVWLDINAGELRNASEYLREGGSHYDVGGLTRVDAELVIPLCDRIERECNAQCFALLFDDDSAGAFTIEILVRLSPRSHRRRIAAADQRFHGNIQQTWGSKWMSFSFLE